MPEFSDLNLELPLELREKFAQTAEALGLSAAEALEILIVRFVEEGGYPFDAKNERPRINWNDPRIIKPHRKDGKLRY